MGRDVKVGLVLGALLVAVVAVVFFRRDDQTRDKFAKLLPAPETVATTARDLLGPSPSDPYKVAPEFLAPPWRRSSLEARPPTRKRSEQPGRLSARPSSTRTPSGRRPGAILQPPQFRPTKTTAPPAKKSVTAPKARRANPPAPAARAKPRLYTIQENDTLSDIGKRMLGDASLYPLLYQANRDLLQDPDRLPVGQTIRIPDPPPPASRSLSRKAPTPLSPLERGARGQRYPGTYVVKENDTLMRIARRIYKNEARYWAIFQANRDQLATPDDLRAGMVLRLPK